MRQNHPQNEAKNTTKMQKNNKKLVKTNAKNIQKSCHNLQQNSPKNAQKEGPKSMKIHDGLYVFS